MKPDMGILIVYSNKNNKCFIETSHNINAYVNRTKFQLSSNGHPKSELQKEWNDFGFDCFTIEILEILKYDKDESKTDYSEELDVLKMIWQERLEKEGKEFYKS